VADRANLAKAYLRLGRFEEAIRAAKPLADVRPDDIEIHTLLSVAYYGSGRYEEAATTLDRFWSVISSENRAGEMALRGLIHARLDQQEEALAVLLRAVEISPGEVTALHEISRIYASRGEADKAEEFIGRLERAHAARTAAEHRIIRQVELFYELQTKWKGEQYADVIRVARRLLEISEDRAGPVLYQYIAESYERLGRPEDARAARAESESSQR
jgi:tetratricopeptide (TPR) repeat protein